ncbi:MAG: hypothetical protein OXI60_11230 [Acidiferrobacterales bacterium]|nr:hypothetical protein [Acidiferrobacterales bacterium]
MKKIFFMLCLSLSALSLVSCVGGGSGGQVSSLSKTPFGVSLEDSPGSKTASHYAGVKLDVIVPVFDPNIPEDPDEYEKLGVWPELRRTESVRFAQAMKLALQDTMAFGDVRIAPDVAVAGDLYVIGRVDKSNGEDIEIYIQVYDASGKRWSKKTFKHRVKEYHWRDVRQKDKDPYQPVFSKAAEHIVSLLKKVPQQRLGDVRAITEIKFASAFVPGVYSDHVTVENNKIQLVSLPPENDPMLERTRAIRVVDGLFMDKMQTHYNSLVRDTNDSYVSWQEHSLTSAKQAREAKSKAAGQAILGGLLLLGAAYAASESDSTGDQLVTAGLATGGVLMLQDSFSANAEGKFHQENLMELGQTLNFEVAPQIVEFENTTLELRGGVKSQYRQWLTVLGDLYERERIPDIQL